MTLSSRRRSKAPAKGFPTTPHSWFFTGRFLRYTPLFPRFSSWQDISIAPRIHDISPQSWRRLNPPSKGFHSTPRSPQTDHSSSRNSAVLPPLLLIIPYPGFYPPYLRQYMAVSHDSAITGFVLLYAIERRTNVHTIPLLAVARLREELPGPAETLTCLLLASQPRNLRHLNPW